MGSIFDKLEQLGKLNRLAESLVPKDPLTSFRRDLAALQKPFTEASRLAQATVPGSAVQSIIAQSVAQTAAPSAAIAKAGQPQKALAQIAGSSARVQEQLRAFTHNYGVDREAGIYDQLRTATRVYDIYREDRFYAQLRTAARIYDIYREDRFYAQLRTGLSIQMARYPQPWSQGLSDARALAFGERLQLVPARFGVLFKSPTSRSSLTASLAFDATALLSPDSTAFEIERSVDGIWNSLRDLSDNARSQAEAESKLDAPERQDEEHKSRAPNSTTLVLRNKGDLYTRALSPGQLPPIRVFFGYHKNEEEMRDKLLQHLCVLKHRGLIDVPHHSNITSDKRSATQIWHDPELAKIVLLLVSAAYLDELCSTGMLDQLQHINRAQQARIVPVLTKTVDYEGTFIETLTLLPSNKRAVASWNDLDDALYDVARGVRDVVDYLAGNRARF